MSRCRCCNAPLSNHDTPVINKYTKQEEDFCGVCRATSRWSFVDREYTGGMFPVEGVTPPLPTHNDY